MGSKNLLRNMKVADTLYFYSFGNKILKHLSDILIYMESNLNLYMTVLTITFPYLSGRCKVTLYSNRTIYPRYTPRERTLTQAQRGTFSPSASTASCPLPKGAGTQGVR